tara:strand:+ start:290 stop:622 length:333 start_codon:yes stop_codon:yes gene_type:complete
MKKSDNIVYSTEKNFYNDDIEDIKEHNEIPPSRQNIRLHLQRLPGNRIVTIVEGYIGSNKMFLELSKYLKKSCGVGGSTKNQTILIQGNHREKILKLLSERGFKVKVSGG